MKTLEAMGHPEFELTTVVGHLIVAFGSTHYAIPVTQVREIITSVQITSVPGSPAYLEGVTNLRGHILPIINLRKKFSLIDGGQTPRDCFVVLTYCVDDSTLEFGIRVDSVVEVAKIRVTDIDPAPVVNDLSDNLVFSSVARTESGVKLILDTATLVDQLKKDISLANKAGSRRPGPSV